VSWRKISVCWLVGVVSDYVLGNYAQSMRIQEAL
jgi:hypothetical protein